MASPGATAHVLEELVSQVAEMIDETGVVAALAGPGGELRSTAATDGEVADLLAEELSLDEGPAVDCVAAGSVVSADDLDEEDRWPRYRAHASSAGVRSVLAVPLRVGRQPAGALAVVSAPVRRWHESEIFAAELMSDLVSGYLAHEAELQQVRRTVDQLREALVSRIDIEQAKGMLAGELGCTVDQAYAMLRRHARSNNLTLHSVARAVVHLGLRPPAERTRQGTPSAQHPQRTGDD